jgi:molecular chaperone GrpE
MSDELDTEVPVKVIDRRWWVHKDEAETSEPSDGAGWHLGKPTYVEELERQLAEKDRRLQETLSKYREAAREFDDARARQRRDTAKEIERGRRTFLAEMLDVADNLDRALEAGRTATTPETLVQGVELVRRQFLAKLESIGVTRVDPLGDPFDPSTHDAITVVPTTEPAQDGIVCGVLAPGYLVGDDVLRPARVAVTRLEPSDRG